MNSIDDIINYEEEYKVYFPDVKITNNSIVTHCPFHDDRNPSFSVDLKTGMFNCFGCKEHGNLFVFISKKENIDTATVYNNICAKYGIEFNDLKQQIEELDNKKYTIERYAQEKKIPVEILQKRFGITNHRNGIMIPYKDEQGNVVRERYRGVNKTFRWNKGNNIILYGLDNLKTSNPEDIIILVEGESDAQSLSICMFPVLGVPGAQTFKQVWVKHLKNKKVYIHNEGDAGGELFKNSICSTLHKVKYKQSVYEFSCNDLGFKDPSDMYKSYNVVFDGKLNFNRLQLFKEDFKKLYESKEPLNLEAVVKKAEQPFPDMPDLIMPERYKITEEGILYQNENGVVEHICRLPVFINCIYRNMLEGTEELELLYRKYDKWNSIVTTRSIINNNKAILQLGDKGIMISGNNAKRLSDYFGELDELNYGKIPIKKCVSQMGWYEKNFLPHHAGDIQLRSDNVNIISGYTTSGDYDTWKDRIKELKDNDYFNFMLMASFAAPLIRLLKLRNIIIFFWADTRAGKTAGLKSALSVWGNPDKIMASFNATQVGIERTITLYNDLPFGVDEKQSAGGDKDKLNNLIYMIGQGTGKLRGNKSGSLQEVKNWQTLTIGTGEEPIVEETAQNGINSRVIELYGKVIEDEQKAAKMHQFTVDNYGYAGKEYIRYVAENYVGKNNNDKLKEIYNKIFSDFEDYEKSVIGSHKSIVSAICTAMYIANKVIWHEDDIESCILFGKRIIKILGSKFKQDIVDKAYEHTIGWALSNVNMFTLLSKSQIYGFRKESTINGKRRNTLNIVQVALQKELVNAGFNYKKTIQGFYERGYIYAPDYEKEKRFTTKRSEGGIIGRYIVLFIDDDTSLSMEEKNEQDERDFDMVCELEFIDRTYSQKNPIIEVTGDYTGEDKVPKKKE